MKKSARYFIFTPLLMAASSHTFALSCGLDSKRNRIEANNYIFQLLDYIDTPINGIATEVRTSSINDRPNEPHAVQTINYDVDGLIIKSDYDLYSSNNTLLYTERLNKTKSGWKNIIEDYEEKRSSIIKFVTDYQGRIVQSQQEKNSADFIFIQTDSYIYNNKNCLINKRVEWQLKGQDGNGKFTGNDDYGASKYTFEYDFKKGSDLLQSQPLVKIVYNFSNNSEAENRYSYQNDKHERLTTLETTYISKAGSTTYLTQFIAFNDKNDWLTAMKHNATQNDNRVTKTVREISYY
ncbi:hypothetical protein PT276_02245 [Orbaceae bacterium ESL0721]|nr:hypothetical protein [Orbaceae bacterium ESL0721]